MRSIGCHISASGGLASIITRAKTLEVDAIQMFGASPVRWKAPLPHEKDAQEFIRLCKEAGISDIFLHAPYLINLTSPKETLRLLSHQLLLRHLEIAELLEARGVIFHVGSRGDMDIKESRVIVVNAIKDILQRVSGSTLIMENNAGAGNLVGDTLEELAEIYHGVSQKRFNICIDTAHVFASGMLSSFEVKDIDNFVKAFDNAIGIQVLTAFHVNDSKVPAGAKKDRHENIGEGYIGKKGIQNFINHPKLKNIPLLLEVPGFDGGGPDKKNLDIIRSLVE